jgi:hypothetical protein
VVKRALSPVAIKFEYLTRFPARWILEHRKVEGAVAKAVWLLLPLQYYVLTSLVGGYSSAAYLPAAMVTLVCLVAIFAVSCILAAVLWLGFADTFEQRCRIWASSLIVIWTASTFLLAISYFLGLRTNVQTDFVGGWVCSHLRSYLDCQGSYPSYDPRTWVVYLIYSFLALFFLQAIHVIWNFLHNRRQQVKSISWREPYSLIVITVNTSVMTMLYGTSTLPHGG